MLHRWLGRDDPCRQEPIILRGGTYLLRNRTHLANLPKTFFFFNISRPTRSPLTAVHTSDYTPRLCRDNKLVLIPILILLTLRKLVDRFCNTHAQIYYHSTHGSFSAGDSVQGGHRRLFQWQRSGVRRQITSSAVGHTSVSDAVGQVATQPGSHRSDSTAWS